MDRKIYCISGLGADHRMFQKLSIEGTQLVPVPWPPFDKHDGLVCYAQKVAAAITDTDPTIIGLSFGGMIATEIAKMMKVKQTFLVSSAKFNMELGNTSGILSLLIKGGLLPYSFLKKPNKIIFDRFGAKTEEDKALLTAVLNDTDSAFLRWAFKAILEWQNSVRPERLIHIHGTSDKIIASENVQPDYWVKDGGHLMVYNHAMAVSTVIQDNLIH
ncbi:MAG: alpha/beta hydrolase [Taibaiella sp.]|nr:alpha/beta hydrolase [Taibaiella sp.]